MSFVVAAVGVGVGVAKLVGASKRKKAAKEAQKKAAAEMDAKKKQYEALDTSNLNKNMENKMEDLTINQKGMELQSQKSAQSRANVMEGMKDAAGGSGIAALAQQMANQGSLDAAESGKMIGDQEAANQKAASTEASKIQDAEIAGEEKSRTLKKDKVGTLLGMAQGEHQAASDAKAQAGKDQMNAIGGIATSVVGSDRRLKKNITKIGKSTSGLNIYSFEYKNPTDGKGLFQGVMSNEVPQEAVINNGEYDMVNYSLLDVEFKQI
jgi:hypothetical protein